MHTLQIHFSNGFLDAPMVDWTTYLFILQFAFCSVCNLLQVCEQASLPI